MRYVPGPSVPPSVVSRYFDSLDVEVYRTKDFATTLTSSI